MSWSGMMVARLKDALSVQKKPDELSSYSAKGVA
jgi:hypothetical protein